MKEKESLHGLTCPNCGGIVQIPEGHIIVQCPYCDMRSLVRGDRGLRRFQVPQRVERADAMNALERFFSTNMAIARNVKNKSIITESFIAYLPFWTVWARIGAWIFGEEEVSSGDSTEYRPREIRVVQEMTWSGSACDVGEFGVDRIPLVDQELEPFDPEELHNSGLVFEPAGSFSEAREAAENQFREIVRRKAGLDRLSQLFLRKLRQQFGLVYYPLWVLRYRYRDRSFQVVVDGHSGKVLYGKAPGNTWYRAAVLVLGMAAGAFLAIDVPSLILSVASDDIGLGVLGFSLAVFAAGIGLMVVSYRAFRYGEHFEYKASGPKKFAGIENPLEVVSGVKDVEKWINQLS